MAATTKYSDDMPEKLIKAMRDGKSIVRFCAHNNIHRDTFYEWVKKHPEFSMAYKLAKVKCESYWEEWLVGNFDNRNVNSALVKLFMANRFGWHENKEVNIKVDDITEKAKQNLGQYEKDY